MGRFLLAMVAGNCVLILAPLVQRSHRDLIRDWYIAAVAGLLGLALLAWFFWPSGGYLVALLWLGLIIVPWYGILVLKRAQATNDWQRAANASRLVWRFMRKRSYATIAELYAARAVSETQPSRAVPMLQAALTTTRPAEERRWFELELASIQGDWEQLYTLAQAMYAEHPADPSALAGMLRALGLLGRVDELIALFTEQLEQIETWELHQRLRWFSWLFALTGNVQNTERIAEVWPDPKPDFIEQQCAIAHWLAGDEATAAALFDSLPASADPLYQQRQQRLYERLAAIKLKLLALTPAQRDQLQQITAAWAGRLPVPQAQKRPV